VRGKGKMPIKSRIRLSFVIFLFLCFSICICKAQEINPTSTLERGIGQFQHENYDEALSLLQQARQEDPSSTLAAYYLGLDYKQLQDYKNAIPHLKAAVTQTPKIIGALIELIDCLYQVGEYEEAFKWVAEAQKEGIRPAQVAFLKGLILLRQDNNQQAIDAFTQAKQLDRAIEQQCDYQIGIAHLKSKEFDYAQEVFNQVIALEPLSSVARYANEYLNAIARRQEAMRKWKLSVGMVWQYDDNVVLMPNDASLAADISDKEDWRVVYNANLEYNHKFSERFSLKNQYFFYYAKQNDLGFYDTVSNSILIQPNIAFKRSLLSFPTTYTHTLVNDRSYLNNPATNCIYNFMLSDMQMAQVFLKYNYRDFLWTPTTSDENRDGNDLGGGLGWYLFYAQRKGFFNLRYEANNDWAKGSNWEYTGNRVSSALLVPVTDKIKFLFSGNVFFQNFSNTHTVYDLKRKDTVYTLSPMVTYEFHKDWEIQAQYTYIKDDSNIGVYSYNRNISSIGLQFKF
jgi:pentatricopeptide repeat protein